MVKFEAPEHTKGPLAGWSVTGRWTTVKRDPEWRGDVGYEVYDWRLHWSPVRPDEPLDAALAVEAALWEWRDRGAPDHIEVDAVYESSLSASAGSQDDPFQDITGTQGGHEGYLANRRKGA